MGPATYIIVFNLSNIAHLFQSRRSNLVRQMQHDPTPSWKERGNNLFEVRRNEQRTKTSEWWILVYQLQALGEQAWAQRLQVGGAWERIKLASLMLSRRVWGHRPERDG